MKVIFNYFYGTVQSFHHLLRPFLPFFVTSCLCLSPSFLVSISFSPLFSTLCSTPFPSFPATYTPFLSFSFPVFVSFLLSLPYFLLSLSFFFLSSRLSAPLSFCNPKHLHAFLLFLISPLPPSNHRPNVYCAHPHL